ncbi:MAG: agmatinase [Pseudomonadota bacterium]|nr:agmatinase [Pseudomonadota bacterium]
MRTAFTDNLSKVDIGLVGVPWDGGTTNRPGARHGPREVRNQSSLMRTHNQSTGVAPYELCNIFDVGDAWVKKPFEISGALDEIQEFFEILHKANVKPISIGGDHSITLPILRAIAKDKPLGIIQFDAHCDTGDDYLGSPLHHGATFRRATEEGLIDPKRTVQIGIRGGTVLPDLWRFSRESGMRIVTMDELYETGADAIIEEARQIVGTEPTYISFDVDGLDVVFAPGTGTPEVGGFSSYEALRMLRGLGGLNIVGGDVVEIAPPFDPSGVTAITGAALMFEILCLVAESHANEK